MRKKKINLDLEIKKLSKQLIQGYGSECRPGHSDPCRCENGDFDY